MQCRNVYCRCRSLNTILSTYPEGFTALDTSYITFDSYLITDTKSYVLSLSNVIELENLCEQYNFLSLKMSLAFIYINLDNFTQGIPLLEEIKTHLNPVIDHVAIDWIKDTDYNFNITRSKDRCDITLEITLFNSYIVNEDLNITNAILHDWNVLVTSHPKSTIIDMYYRLLNIHSNQVENVMELTDKSTNIIVRNGIASGAIISTQNGEYKDPILIKEILKDTILASSEVNSFSHSADLINKKWICRIHSILMKTYRYKEKIVGTFIPRKHHYILPTGCYRDYNVRIGSDGIIFPQYIEVHNLMETLFRQINECLDKIRSTEKKTRSGKEFFYDMYSYESVYTIAAKFHHVLIQIHPFSDGNGRLTRLISSIPLIMCGFPPIIILSKNRGRYFEALRNADITKNLTKLINTFQTNALDSIQLLSKILDDEEKDMDVDFLYEVDGISTQQY